MDTIAVIAAALLGIAAGPLLRRAIDQVPDRRPLFGDESDPVRSRALVPVASWFDGAPYGTTSYLVNADDREPEDLATITTTSRRRAPIIDLSAAALMAAMGWRFGWSPDLLAFLVFVAAIVVVTVIDIDHYRIPNLVVYPTLLACGVLLALSAVVAGATGGLIGAGLGAVAYYAFLFIFWFIYPKGMGFGDVKLALVLGMHTGWAGSIVEADGDLFYAGWEFAMSLVLWGALIGSGLGALIGIGAMLARGRRAAFPFGPALCAGALIAITFSETLLN